MDSGPGEAASPEVLCAASGSSTEPLSTVATDSLSLGCVRLITYWRVSGASALSSRKCLISEETVRQLEPRGHFINKQHKNKIIEPNLGINLTKEVHGLYTESYKH